MRGIEHRRPRHGPTASIVLDRVRELRREQSDAERRLWESLRNRQLHGVKFRRQFAIGPFIADFCSIEKKLVVEVDGGQHDSEVQNAYDQRRTCFLEANGYTVLRVWAIDVIRDTHAVASAIEEALTKRSDPEKRG